MRIICQTAIVAALSLGVVFSAPGQWREDGMDVPDSAWSKHKGNFGAMLLLSDKPEEFLTAWDQRTEGVPIKTADTVERGAPIVAFVIFTGCAPDDKGQCNASVDFTVLRPDGSEYAKHENQDLWKNKPAIEGQALQLSADYMGVIIEPDDPLGQYEVRVIARDLNADVSLELTRQFAATDKAE